MKLTFLRNYSLIFFRQGLDPQPSTSEKSFKNIFFGLVSFHREPDVLSLLKIGRTYDSSSQLIMVNQLFLSFRSQLANDQMNLFKVRDHFGWLLMATGICAWVLRPCGLESHLSQSFCLIFLVFLLEIYFFRENDLFYLGYTFCVVDFFQAHSFLKNFKFIDCLGEIPNWYEKFMFLIIFENSCSFDCYRNCYVRPFF